MYINVIVSSFVHTIPYRKKIVRNEICWLLQQVSFVKEGKAFYILLDYVIISVLS
jgi:hypothetical protein